MKIRNAVPHLFTSGNLLCGCIAIVKAFEGDLVWSAYLVGIAAVLDFFDGFVARALKVQGEFGKQLDSLADCVTFGVVPGVVMYHLMHASFNHMYLDRFEGPVFLASTFSKDKTELRFFLPYLGFLISIFSALRLAKFNLDTRQSDSFIGVPTPANSILICSLPLVLHFYKESSSGVEVYYFFQSIILNFLFLLLLTLIMSYLLVAELPLFALKFKNFKWKGNEIRYSFLVLSVLFLVFFKFVGLPLIIILYILMSIGNNIFTAKKIREADN